MDREQVLKLAREADLRLRCAPDSMEAIHHFARLARKAALEEAREAVAEVERLYEQINQRHGHEYYDTSDDKRRAAEECVEAIAALIDKEPSHNDFSTKEHIK